MYISKKVKLLTIFLLLSSFSFSQTQEFTLSELTEVAFMPISSIDSFLRVKNYKYKPSEINKGDNDFIYYENIYKKTYANGVIISPEKFSNMTTTHSITIVKSDDKLYNELKKEVKDNPNTKKMREEIDNIKSITVYSDGLTESNFTIHSMDGYIVYSVQIRFNPSLEYLKKK